MSFSDQVKRSFQFLETEYQFSPTIEDGGVKYKKPGLTILIGWYKGEVDIVKIFKIGRRHLASLLIMVKPVPVPKYSRYLLRRSREVNTRGNNRKPHVI